MCFQEKVCSDDLDLGLLTVFNDKLEIVVVINNTGLRRLHRSSRLPFMQYDV